MKVMVTILFFFICVTAALALDVDGGNVVLDTDGQALTKKDSYYIVPSGGGGGGLTATSLDYNLDPPCRLGIIQDKEENSVGEKLQFFPSNKDDEYVLMSTDQNIGFNTYSMCSHRDFVWRVDSNSVNESSPQQFILGGGTIGNPGNETIWNWFKIEPFQDTTYKFSYCPSVCNSCNVTCRDVGIFVDGDGLRRLALTDDVPLGVKFKKFILP